MGRDHYHHLKYRPRRWKSSRYRKTPFNLKLWVKSSWERIVMSMFISPLLCIVASIAIGICMTRLDYYRNDQGWKPPVYITTNVDSARSILSTIAAATISFAGTAFSVSLLVIQLGSSQFSPRVVHTLFKDPFNRRVVAMVMGTFTYCLVVMRSVGDPMSEEDEGAVVPNLSIALAFALGIASLLATVAFIDHSANSMDVSQLFETITRDTMMHIDWNWAEDNDYEQDVNEDYSENRKVNYQDRVKHKPTETTFCTNSSKDENQFIYKTFSERNPIEHRNKKSKAAINSTANEKTEVQQKDADAKEQDDCYVVRFQTSGWIEEIDTQSLLKLVPKNGYIKLHTMAGRYACPGSAVCSVYPRPKDFESNRQNYSIKFDVNAEDHSEEYDLEDEFDLNVLDTIMIGYSRTIRGDATYGLRQLVDIVLRALSAGVNDPTTAQDGIFHIAAVVTEFLKRNPPATVLKTEHGGKLVRTEQPDHDRIVRLAFEEIRVCASSMPIVALYVLEALRLIRESLEASGRHCRAPEIERQARLMEQCILNDSHIKEDRESIMKARQDRFDDPVGKRVNFVS